MLRTSLYHLAFLCLVALTACSKKQADTPVPSRGAADLRGSIRLLDEFQDSTIALSAAPDLSVKATGAEGETPATLDPATGTFVFPNLKPGTYTITYAAQGFATIVQPAVEHVGGEATVRPVASTYRISTTRDSILNLANNIQTIYRRLEVDTAISPWPANTPLVLSASDTLVRFDTANRKVELRGPGTWTFGTPQVLRKIRSVRLQNKQVNVSTVKFSGQPSTSSRPRGSVVFFSDSPDVSPTNYKLRAVGYTSGASRVVTFPGLSNRGLQAFVDAGILRTPDQPNPNRVVYAVSYGISGRQIWIGAIESAGAVIIPGLNPQPTPVVQLELPERP